MKAASSRAAGLWLALLVALLVVVPLVCGRAAVTSFFTQAVIISLLAMSYNMLMGQTGMLSFGHAVYSGLGAYCTIHFLNRFTADGLGVGIFLLPLVGAAAGAFFGLVLGFVSTRRSGIAFAMITLGISEMLVHLSLMMPGWSGGESGITTDRMLYEPILGFDLGSDLQAYYYILAWALAAVALQFAVTRTPLGSLANAVRDNPERVMFIGFNPQKIRLFVMVLSGMFAGIGGSLTAVSYEIVTSETLGLGQSGMLLIAAYLGGAGFFLGPVFGAFVYVLFLSVVASLTHAWLLYFGLLFVLVVLFSPAGLLPMLKAVPGYGPRQWLRAAVAALMAAAAVQFIERLYAYLEGRAAGSAPALADAAPAMAAALAVFLVLAVALRRTAGSGRQPAAGAREAA